MDRDAQYGAIVAGSYQGLADLKPLSVSKPVHEYGLRIWKDKAANGER